MPTWTPALDPRETKKYQAQFAKNIPTGAILSSPVVTPPQEAIDAGLVAASEDVVDDPDTGETDTAVEITFSVQAGNQADVGWSNAGQVFPIIVGATVSATGEVLNQAFNLTVKKSGAPAITWSYDPALSRDLDQVRFRVQDINSAKPLLQDQEILGLLVGDSVLGASIKAARALSARFAMKVTTAADGVRVELSKRSEAYSKLADQLVKQRNDETSAQASLANGNMAVPLVGGVSVSEMTTVRANTDRPASRVRVGMHDNPNIPDC